MSKRENVPHYARGSIEYIDFLAAHHGRDQVILYILMTIGKYSSRGIYKGQLKSDLEKIRNYATIALEMLEDESSD